MLVFVLVFSKVAHLSSARGAATRCWCWPVMLPWQLFSSTVSESSNSLVNNANLVSKVYFLAWPYRSVRWPWV